MPDLLNYIFKVVPLKSVFFLYTILWYLNYFAKLLWYSRWSYYIIYTSLDPVWHTVFNTVIYFTCTYIFSLTNFISLMETISFVIIHTIPMSRVLRALLQSSNRFLNLVGAWVKRKKLEKRDSHFSLKSWEDI